MNAQLPFAPANEFSDATMAIVADCVRLVMTLPPRDRLNAVAAIARCWTDFEDVRKTEIASEELPTAPGRPG